MEASVWKWSCSINSFSYQILTIKEECGNENNLIVHWKRHISYELKILICTKITWETAVVLYSVRKTWYSFFCLFSIYKWEPLGYDNLVEAVHLGIFTWNPAWFAIIKGYYLIRRSRENNILGFFLAVLKLLWLVCENSNPQIGRAPVQFSLWHWMLRMMWWISLIYVW